MFVNFGALFLHFELVGAESSRLLELAGGFGGILTMCVEGGFLNRMFVLLFRYFCQGVSVGLTFSMLT